MFTLTTNENRDGNRLIVAGCQMLAASGDIEDSVMQFFWICLGINASVSFHDRKLFMTGFNSRSQCRYLQNFVDPNKPDIQPGHKFIFAV